MCEEANDDYIAAYKRKWNPLVRFLRCLNLFTSKCPNCGVGRISYCGDDWIGRVGISVYRCDCCNTKFV